MAFALLVTMAAAAVVAPSSPRELQANVDASAVNRVVDWRDVISGGGVPLSNNPHNYWNQPLATRLPNGSWVVVLTQASFEEGQTNQKVVSVLHPSPDLNDPGFNPAVDIEANPFGPSAGWVVPLFAPDLGGGRAGHGRLYVSTNRLSSLEPRSTMPTL